MARHFPEVIRICEFFRADAQLVRAKSDFGKKPRASPAIVIENGNRFLSALAQLTRDQQRREMIP